MPKDLFLVENDNPYFTPEPYRNEINQSSNIIYIIDKIAKIKEINYEKVEGLTTNNTTRLFKKMK